MEFPKGKKIILFDGFCNLCDSLVQFVIRHDQQDQFRFVALQSELGQKIISHIGIGHKNIDSVVLYIPGKAYYTKSNAAIQIAKNLGGFFHLGTIFRILPTPLRNWVYDYVAAKRYHWYGKKEVCLIPTAELASKFLT
ncbi:MAG: DCC1-like thiol-disulfide oxidoreductase family protein [Flavobacteriaceae bacterium]